MALIDFNLNVSPVKEVLPILLLDRTTKKNIIFATDSYAEQGEEYGAKRQITEQALLVLDIRPRVLKDAKEQEQRTRKKAEVFTPAWVCCLMNNYADEVWFDRADVFGHLEKEKWTASAEAVQMPPQKSWQAYVDARRLEITCGEAPYLASRYDMGTGEVIPIKDRVGLLDRKLRIVSENTETEAEWLKWAMRALQAVYGYEYQGDNVLLARVNLLMTFAEYLQEQWQRNATLEELKEAAKVISWNIWQMDGLKGTTPMGALYEQYHQMSLFEMFEQETESQEETVESVPCRIFDWRGQNKSLVFNAFRERRNGSMKFDFIIGNPPYQETTESDSTRMPPVYNLFMDEAYAVADVVELVTPARFLFDTGFTPKAWNDKMLNDKHFKVLHYESESNKFFQNTTITGGLIISYHDNNSTFEPIGTFTKYQELNSILHKVKQVEPRYMDEFVFPSLNYGLSEIMKSEHPELLDRLRTSAFTTLADVFYDAVPDDKQDYISMLGLLNGKRTTKYIRRDYIKDNSGIVDKYNLILSEANGAAGQIGAPVPARIIGKATISEPGNAYTQTFIGIGAFDTLEEAKIAAKYLETKFARVMLGIKKATQHTPRPTWTCVPIQNFTAASDIDWSQSVAGVDRQLYAKYGLSDKEIAFIETNVKEMA